MKHRAFLKVWAQRETNTKQTGASRLDYPRQLELERRFCFGCRRRFSAVEAWTLCSLVSFLLPVGLAQPNPDPTSLTPTEGQDLTFSTNLILEPQPHPDVDIEGEEEHDVRDRPLRRILQLLGLQPCRPIDLNARRFRFGVCADDDGSCPAAGCVLCYCSRFFAPVHADFNDTSSAREARKLEEDPRLVVRMEAFNLPVLVGTLLCGFTLVSNCVR